MNVKEALTLKPGDKVRVMKTSNGYNSHLRWISPEASNRGTKFVSSGEILTIKSISVASGRSVHISFEETEDYTTATPGQIQYHGPIKTPKQLMESNLKKMLDTRQDLEEKIESLQSKLRFMQDNDLDEFDETLYKSFSILSIMDNKKDLSKLEKSMLIADIVNDRR